MSHPGELKYVNKLCFEIENKLRWGSLQDWKNSNFIELSNEVKRCSGIRISTDTLKRILGKMKTTEQYNPQLATKDALAIFLGYLNWSDFKVENPLPSEELTIISSAPSEVINITNARRLDYKFWSIVVIVLGSVSWFIFALNSSSDPIDYSTFNFKIQGKYLRGNAYHTAVFDYNVSSVPTDSIFMDFGDNTKRIWLKEKKGTISHYYRGPGQYKVNLIAGDQTMYDTIVYLTTDNWESHTFFSKGEFHEYLPIYDFKDSLTGLMSVDKNMPRIKGIDTTQLYWVQYSNYIEYDRDGDNFELISELKNNLEIIPARCNHVRVEVIGKTGVIKLYFLRDGCSKWVRLQFGEVYLNGENSDLSTFGKDFLEFQKVTIKNSNKRVSVYFNDTLLLEQTYQHPIGEIVGLAYIFSGSGGAVKSSELNSNPLLLE